MRPEEETSVRPGSVLMYSSPGNREPCEDLEHRRDMVKLGRAALEFPHVQCADT